MRLDLLIVTLIRTIELRTIKIGVDPIGTHQLLMGTPLGYSAIHHHQDLVCAADRREPVGDHDRGSPHQCCVEGPLNGVFALGIQMGRCLIQDQNAGCFE